MLIVFDLVDGVQLLFNCFRLVDKLFLIIPTPLMKKMQLKSSNSKLQALHIMVQKLRNL